MFNCKKLPNCFSKWQYYFVSSLAMFKSSNYSACSPALGSGFFLFCLFVLFVCFFCFYKFIYLFTFDCIGSSFLCKGFLQLRRAGATLHRGARASHCHGLSHCGAQAPDAQAQQLWRTGLVAPWHVGSSQTRARTRVPCIGRRILNHCATRKARQCFILAILIGVSVNILKNSLLKHNIQT